LRATGLTPYEAMFGRKSTLYLIDVNDDIRSMNIYKNFIYNIILLDTVLAEKAAVSHVDFVKNMQKIWELARKKREQYREKMMNQYNKTHNVFLYVHLYINLYY
jgi:hypothetical protein